MVRPIASADEVKYSWHDGCPVSFNDLRVVTLTYWGFDNQVHDGSLIVNSDATDAILRAFRTLFDSKFPIDQMKPIDRFQGDDNLSMAADNTAAFNCRQVVGRPGIWSRHSYGRAIDINPLENPYVVGSTVLPPEGKRYADRSLSAQGMIHPGDAAVQAFASVGWKWGGAWISKKDYQHFSADGL